MFRRGFDEKANVDKVFGMFTSLAVMQLFAFSKVGESFQYPYHYWGVQIFQKGIQTVIAPSTSV